MTDPQLDFDVEIAMDGHKSSEGDGRTAADVRRELEQAREREKEETPDGPE
jgi:hypothetical protein